PVQNGSTGPGAAAVAIRAAGQGEEQPGDVDRGSCRGVRRAGKAVPRRRVLCRSGALLREGTLARAPRCPLELLPGARVPAPGRLGEGRDLLRGDARGTARRRARTTLR